MKKDIEAVFRKLGIVPVVKIENEKDAVPLAEALTKGGLPCAEVTFRTGAAAASIRRMKEAFPEMIVGAGTVLTAAQVDEALEAGAEFIVSPGLNPRTVTCCQEKGIPVFPGVATASEIEKALELGLRVVKFFPAEANGGLKAIKALAAPYSMMEFMPTGGIGTDNVGEYLRFEKVIACGGTWMVKEKMIAEGQFDRIQQLTREARELAEEAAAGK